MVIGAVLAFVIYWSLGVETTAMFVLGYALAMFLSR